LPLYETNKLTNANLIFRFFFSLFCPNLRANFKTDATKEKFANYFIENKATTTTTTRKTNKQKQNKELIRFEINILLFWCLFFIC
jgi:hypothetical protein